MFGRKPKFELRRKSDEALFEMILETKERWHQLEHTQSLRALDEVAEIGNLAIQIRAARARYFFLFREAKYRKLSGQFVESRMNQARKG